MRLTSVAVAILLLCVVPAHAALHVWTGAASDNFSNANNWIGGSPAGDAEAELLFAATTGSHAPQNDLDNLTVRTLSFSTNGYVLGGKPITVTHDVMNTIGETTIACDLVLAGDVTFFVDANGINVFPSLHLAGALRGNGRFIKDGASVLTMRGPSANTHTGGSVVRRGILILQKPAGVASIPGNLRIYGKVAIESPEQISDEAEVTFEPWGEIRLDGNEMIRSFVALGGDPMASRPDASVIPSVGTTSFSVRESIRASGNIQPYLTDLFLAAPLTVTLQEAGFYAELEGDSSVTIRGDGANDVELTSTHSSPTTFENIRADVDVRYSDVVQRGGSFTGKAGSLRLWKGDLSYASIAGELHLSGGSTVHAFQTQTAPVSCTGPLTLAGVKLIASGLYRQQAGTVIPVIRNTIGQVTGTFDGLPEGAAINGYTITYRGGDGNDVELRSLPPTPEIDGFALLPVAGKIPIHVRVAYGEVRANGPLTLEHSGEILAIVPIVNGSGSVDLPLAPGQYRFKATYPGDANLTAAEGEISVLVFAPTPLLTSIEPNVIPAGGGKVTVTLRGANFIDGAYILGSPGFVVESLQVVSANVLQFVVRSRGTGETGFTSEIHVWQDPGSRRSNPVQLTFASGPPAGPKKLTVTANSITALVKPGATVAMMMTGYHPRLSNRTVLTDTDNDGRVTWTFSRNLPPFLTCAVADLATGEHYLESVIIDDPIQALPITFYRGRSNAYSNVELGGAISDPQLMWVRPGMGAWFEVFGGIVEADVVSDVRLFDATRMKPLGTSPAPPAGVQQGDVFLAISGYDASGYTALVDDTLLAPDAPGELSIGDFAFAYEEDRVVRITIYRTGGSAGTVSARVRTIDESAKSGLDYSPLDERVTLEPGEMWKTIEIALVDDAAYAGTREIIVRLSEPAGITIASAEAEVEIGEAELPPVMSADSVTISEGEGPRSVTTTLRLTGATRLATEVQWGTGFGGGSGKVIFVPGETAKTISIPFHGNRTADGDRALTIDLYSFDAQRGSPEGKVNIVDDDVAHIFVRDATVSEGSSTYTIELTLDLDIVATREVRVAWATRDLSATAGADYTASSGIATFLNLFESKARIQIPIAGDAVAEGVETFEVVLSNPEGAQLARSVARITISDDDATPSISIADRSGFEGSSEEMLVYLSAPAKQPVTFVINTVAGTATDGEFTAWPNITRTIPAGQTTMRISMSSVADSLVEPDETFTVTLSNPTNATLGRATATFTISDKPKPPVLLSIGDARVIEDDAGSKTISVRLSLSVPSAPIRVAWSTADGTATAGTDYVAAQGEVTITNSAEVSITVKGDTELEPDETFTIQLATPAGATLVRSAGIVTIADDDGGGPRRRSVRH